MKKGAVKTSGILTLILYLILFVVAACIAAASFGVQAISDITSSVEILNKIITAIETVFVTFPVELISKFAAGVEAELLTKIFAAVLAVFCGYMIFWGIKEITLAKKDDERFARCKKTCGFMMFIKFMVFFYFLAFVVCQFVLEDVKNVIEPIAKDFGMDMIFVIIGAVLAVYSFIIFLLPVINFSKAAKAFANGGAGYDPNAQYDPNAYYDPNAQQQYNAQPTMQANMPPMPGYQPQYQQNPNQPQPIYNTEPPQGPSIQSQFNPQVQAEEQQRASSILPGQNGVPLNITPKGIEDLERLERLRNSGAITEENYIAMRTKICNTNLS